jgi:hypothetical protein
MNPPSIAVFLLAFILAAPRFASADEDLSILARAALEGDAAAVSRLRDAGPPGLEALFSQHSSLLADMCEGRTPLDDPRAAALRKAVEAVARQRDAHAAGLYWYTDLDEAKQAARATGRHILSLRLLGNLDEEFSCANSRFFRTVLYANAEVSRHLREHFVLHWKSVRPAPRILIDMGDGRRLERTITGNSIHYILDADGTVLDALPGLYGPRAFLDALRKSDQLGRSGNGEFHVAEVDTLRRSWLSDAIRVGAFGEAAAAQIDDTKRESLLARLSVVAFPNATPLASSSPANWSPAQHSDSAGLPPGAAKPARRAFSVSEIDAQQPSPPEMIKPRADSAMPLAVGKSMVEKPMLQRVMPQSRQEASPARENAASSKPLVERMTPELWGKIAALHASRLDLNSRRLMMAKLKPENLTAEERQTGGLVREDTPFARTLRNFERAIAEDIVRNEYLFHERLHEWLAPGGRYAALARDVEGFNTKVYAELFLTPDHDAWLGLVPDDTYTALENDGCACEKHVTR